MEKGRSSRLKRKICKNAKTDNSKVSKILTSLSDKHIEKVHAIVLSSDSEEDCQKQTVLAKPLDETGTSAVGTIHGERKNDNIEQKDSSLHQLRKLIYKMSSVECLDPASLDPFPEHLQEPEVSCKSDGSNTVKLEERLQMTSSSFASEYLTPFPKCCDKCRKLKVCNKPAIRKTVEIDSSQSVSRPDVTLTETTNICNKSTGLSVYRGCDSAQSGCDLSHGISGTIADAGRNTNVATNRGEVRNAEVNNSHLMKDRNSNFYSLQSRNQHHSLHGHHSERERQESCKPLENINIEPMNATVPSAQSTSYEHLEKANNDECAKPDTVLAADGSNSTDLDLIDECRSKSKISSVFQKPGSSESQVSVSRHKQTEESPNTHSKNSARNSFQTKLPQIDDQSSSNAGNINQKDVGEENESSNRKDIPLLSCPMCQMKFNAGTQQMDVDSHLAICLSTAGDDFNW